jgi:hypothetical protein
VRELGWQNLDGDIAMEPRVAGAEDFAHATRADRSDDLERADPRSWSETHCCTSSINAYFLCGTRDKNPRVMNKIDWIWLAGSIAKPERGRFW